MFVKKRKKNSKFLKSEYKQLFHNKVNHYTLVYFNQISSKIVWHRARKTNLLKNGEPREKELPLCYFSESYFQTYEMY